MPARIVAVIRSIQVTAVSVVGKYYWVACELVGGLLKIWFLVVRAQGRATEPRDVLRIALLVAERVVSFC